MDHLGHGSHDAIESVAAAILAIAGAICIWRAYRTRPARLGPAASSLPSRSLAVAPPPPRSLAQIAAWSSAGAAVIHLLAAPGHYAEIGDLASGFVIAAAFQAWWAFRAFHGLTAPIAVTGIVVNAAILGAWALT